MTRKAIVLHMFFSVIGLMATIFYYGLSTEGGDKNAASMYITVFGALSLLYWLISCITIIGTMLFFRKKPHTILPYLIPSVLFFAGIFFFDNIYWGLLGLLGLVSSIFNILAYLINNHNTKQTT